MNPILCILEIDTMLAKKENVFLVVKFSNTFKLCYVQATTKDVIILFSSTGINNMPIKDFKATDVYLSVALISKDLSDIDLKDYADEVIEEYFGRSVFDIEEDLKIAKEVKEIEEAKEKEERLNLAAWTDDKT